MIGEQYFIDIISKVEKIIRYQSVYEDFYSKGVMPDDTIMLRSIIFIFLGLIVASLAAPILAEKKISKTEKIVISVIIFIASFKIIAISSQDMQLYKEMRDCKIELSDLKAYTPIDFTKFPKWASDGLRDEGYIKCARIYKFLKEQESNIKKENDKKIKEKEIALREKEMEEMSKMGK